MTIKIRIMKELNRFDFIKYICNDNNIDFQNDVSKKLPADKKAIKSFVSGRAGQVRIIKKQSKNFRRQRMLFMGNKIYL